MRVTKLHQWKQNKKLSLQCEKVVVTHAKLIYLSLTFKYTTLSIFNVMTIKVIHNQLYLSSDKHLNISLHVWNWPLMHDFVLAVKPAWLRSLDGYKKSSSAYYINSLLLTQLIIYIFPFKYCWYTKIYFLLFNNISSNIYIDRN